MKIFVFKVDERFIDVVYKFFVEEVKIYKVLKGRVVIGDKFINFKELKEELVNDFGGYCGEMEGGVIVYVCYLNNILFVIIRVMFDKVDGSVDVIYDVFVYDVVNNFKDIVLNMLKLI